MPGTVLRQPARSDKTQTAHPADDDVSAIGGHQRLRRRRPPASMPPAHRQRDHHLADVAPGGHQPERVDHLVEAELGDRKRRAGHRRRRGARMS